MIKQDYKSSSRSRRPSMTPLIHHLKLRWGEVLAVAIGVTLLAFALSSDDDKDIDEHPVATGEILLTEQQASTEQTSADSLAERPGLISDRIPLPLDLDELPATSKEQESSQQLSQARTKPVTIRSGDTLSGIFKREGLSAREVFLVTQDKTAEQYLRNIRPGKQLTLEFDDQNQLLALHYEVAINETLQIKRRNDTFKAELISRPIETRQAFASGIIQDSLYQAGKQAGLTDNLIVKLANIFGWDIDFVLDVRKNDSFALIYEEQYLDGELIGHGDILVAQFVNQGEVFRAVRYVDSDGTDNFYTPDGKSMRKAFLRAPLNFMYISSNFKPRRFHPILKRWKAHRGIDYRAPTGTPVFAAGDGKVIASSYNKYNGKYIFIQHGNNIVTKYLHLSRRAVSHGKRVKQGQIIGYVGATGLAEAPHLHYEFVVGGVHRNPRTVKLPEAKPVDKSERTRFEQQTAPLLASLETHEKFLSISSGN